MKFKLPTEKEKFKFYFEKYLEYEGVIELKKITRRSINQNSYLHVCISIFAIELGYTLEEMKDLLKSNCPFISYTKKGRQFTKQTSKLSTKELTDFIEWIRDLAGKQGIYIPSSEDYFRDWATIEREIEMNKQYL